MKKNKNNSSQRVDSELLSDDTAVITNTCEQQPLGKLAGSCQGSAHFSALNTLLPQRLLVSRGPERPDCWSKGFSGLNEFNWFVCWFTGRTTEFYTTRREFLLLVSWCFVPVVPRCDIITGSPATALLTVSSALFYFVIRHQELNRNHSWSLVPARLGLFYCSVKNLPVRINRR